jgi:hypothetical protein
MEAQVGSGEWQPHPSHRPLYFLPMIDVRLRSMSAFSVNMLSLVLGLGNSSSSASEHLLNDARQVPEHFTVAGPYRVSTVVLVLDEHPARMAKASRMTITRLFDEVGMARG